MSLFQMRFVIDAFFIAEASVYNRGSLECKIRCSVDRWRYEQSAVGTVTIGPAEASVWYPL